MGGVTQPYGLFFLGVGAEGGVGLLTSHLTIAKIQIVGTPPNNKLA